MNDQDSEKLKRIRKYVEDYIESTKNRGKMHGGISEIEAQWWALDPIYLILNDVPEDKMHLFIGEFESLIGLGTKNYSSFIEDKNPENPYEELSKLRNEYEKWRERKISELKDSNKSL